MLHEAMGVDFIILTSTAVDVPVPPVKLTRVSARDALLIFERGVNVANTYVSVQFTDSGTAIVSATAQRSDATRYYTLSLATHPESGLELDDMVAAVEAAAAFVEDPTLRLSVHEETELLFIEGGQEAINMVIESVDRVLDSTQGRLLNAHNSGVSIQNRALSSTNKELVAEVQGLRERLEASGASAEAAEVRSEMLRSEVDDLRTVLAQAQATQELELTRARLEAEAAATRTEIRLEESLRVSNELRERLAGVERLLAQSQRALKETQDELARLRAERQGGGGGSSR